MTHDEIKQFIAEQTECGVSLSHIQDMLNEKGAKLTFMELRLIASEIESGLWKKQEEVQEPKQEDAPPAAAQEEGAAEERVPAEDSVPEEGGEPIADDAGKGVADAEAKPRGKTTVTISPIQRPGCVASGSVTFGSGVTGTWALDQLGRLMFEDISGRPDKQDVAEFQMELQKAFGG